MKPVFRRSAVIAAAALLLGSATATIFVFATATPDDVEADINARFSGLDPSASQNPQPDTAKETTARPRKGLPQAKKARRTEHRRHSRSAVDSLPGIEQVDAAAWLIDRELFFAARKTPGAYVENARATFVDEPGGLSGFRLEHTEGHLAAIGLRHGDILTAVNGHPLDHPQNIPRIMAMVMTATQFRLDLLRGTQRISLYYRLR